MVIDLESAELGKVKTVRALYDPVILHEPTQEWESPEGNQLYKDVKAARIKQNIETPTEERIEYATWPETVLYFSTLSMDSQSRTGEVHRYYSYAFRQYLDEWTDIDPSHQPAPVSHNPELSDHQVDRLDDVRFGLKKDRDKYFIENRYDDMDMESVPKTFWLTDYEIERQQDGLDDFAYSAVEQFYDDR